MRVPQVDRLRIMAVSFRSMRKRLCPAGEEGKALVQLLVWALPLHKLPRTPLRKAVWRRAVWLPGCSWLTASPGPARRTC